jgi:catechol 2,3-dioxygenase-like lactoylglutathione lyase family enzyme
MIDHVALEVADVEASKAFYDRALAPLGAAVIMHYGKSYGYGEFHRAAVEAGGSDNGEPGLREYHEHYYGAFVLDPDGNNVEAVCHRPE